MDIQKHNTIQQDAWQSLKKFTPARIALGSTGAAIPLKEVLQFRLAHAHARDAVYAELNMESLTSGLEQLQMPVQRLQSKANNRQEYLQRPDLGRELAEQGDSVFSNNTCDISIIIADGLSATAVNAHALPLLNLLLPMLTGLNYSLSPVSLIQQARVAVSDPVAVLMNARMTIILIGERPGLSSPDSMGVYLTYQSKIDLTDESRNCISNIRPEGLSYKNAADKIFYLVTEAFRLKQTGIALKDNAGLL